MDLEDLKARAREIWGTGDYEPTGRQLEPVSEALVESLGVGPDDRVLDVAAGHGNCAIAAARRGAEVVASDFSPVMIERGRARTEAAGLEITWREADAADLPFEDASFDRVTSVFGAMFAPEQEAVAAELARVTVPGGAAGLTAWTPDSLVSRMVRILRSRGPTPPEGLPDPMAWGDPDHVAALFAGTGCEIVTTHRTLTFSYPSWDDWRRDLSAHGMAVEMRRNISEAAHDELMDEAREFLESHDHGEGETVAYDAEYLEIQARVPN